MLKNELKGCFTKMTIKHFVVLFLFAQMQLREALKYYILKI